MSLLSNPNTCSELVEKPFRNGSERFSLASEVFYPRNRAIMILEALGGALCRGGFPAGAEERVVFLER